jgi:hypothetical protein
MQFTASDHLEGDEERKIKYKQQRVRGGGDRTHNPDQNKCTELLNACAATLGIQKAFCVLKGSP